MPMRGHDILDNPRLNRSTAFTPEERDRYGLRGLLPPVVETQEQQIARVLENCARKPSDIERYIFLMTLQNRNESLFYRTMIEHLREMLPLVYTPTVGQAAQEYAHIYRGSNGLYVTVEDRGRIEEVLRNWRTDAVRVIVVTDGERILGLGDLGVNGITIPIGKLALYVAAGGIEPRATLPIVLDVGTNNETLRDDRMYLGLRRPRATGEEYDAFLDEFVRAVTKVFPDALLQFEDFSTANAHRLLSRYRDRVRTFNDDIQGTAAVGLAGLVAALRITRGALADQRVLFMGAGAANTGIAALLADALVKGGLSRDEAHQRAWFIDSQGLVVASREGLAEHKRPFAHDHAPVADLLTIVEEVRPTALIGATGQPGVFDRPVVEAMARINDRPIIFALSNPTSQAECTAEQAYDWTGGRAVFASGSPFEPVEIDGKTLVPGQGNNVYIFPGMGLGILVSGVSRVPDSLFLAAARALATTVSEERLASGSVYPPLSSIREVSAAIAAEVWRQACDEGLAACDCPDDAVATIRASMYRPEIAAAIEE